MNQRLRKLEKIVERTQCRVKFEPIPISFWALPYEEQKRRLREGSIPAIEWAKTVESEHGV